LRRTRLTIAVTVAAATVVGLPTAASAAPKDVTVQLLAMNDFHGRITETTGSDSQLLTAPGPDGAYGSADDVKTVVGGSANVATTVKTLQASFDDTTKGPHTSLFVGAGDLVSASPFESSVFKDEPTIEVLNAMGLDASSVGNHEFDRGTQELRRISAATDGTYTDDVTECEGITVGVDGCFGTDGHEFEGADFPYLAANVLSKETGEPMLPPYQVFTTPANQKVAMIGVVTKTTPSIVAPTGIADVQFIDEAEAVNTWVPRLQAMGIQAIGVLIHEGGTAGNAAPPTPAYDGCAGLTGPILDINQRIDPAVDLIVSAHTHQAYNCRLADGSGKERLVTQAGYYGRLVTDIRLSLDRTTGDVDRAATYSATNVPVTRTAPDPTVQGIVDYWNGRAAEAGNVVVGSITADITRAYTTPAPTPTVPNPSPVENRGGESSLGNLVAQAQLEALQTPQYGNPVIAFMNPGGLRTDLTYASSQGGEAPGEVTFRELFNVQPFSNTVNAVTLTGAAIKDVLEQQFPSARRSSQLILGTSAGFSYSYDAAAPEGQRVIASSITLNGTPIDPAASYRVVANSFLIGGGDSFAAFTSGTDPITGPVDADTAVAYFRAHSPVSPPPADHAKPV
jgi:5'-nucleotidase